MSHHLPQPNAAQLTRSTHLTEHIRALITANDDWLPFDAYMNAALYTPELGYYTNTLLPFSHWAHEGDFVTAPLLTPLFGATLAQQALEVFELTGSANILEFGAGTGQLAADMLRHFARQGVAVDYQILELSATLAAQQRAIIETALSDIPHRHTFSWRSELPNEFIGLMLGNEVLDAMPVKLIGMAQGAWFERGVVWENNRLVWADHPTAARLPVDSVWEDALHEANSTYLSETHEQQKAFIDSLAACLRTGVILMLDYGFPAREYYHPERSRGTLMCHIQHVAHDDALYHPGVQDITAHVNFSALLPDTHSPLQVVGYTNQANFLINNGILDLLAQTPPEQQRVHANRVHRLLSEAEMGELFKVMAWTKGLDFDTDETLQGFVRGDRSERL